MLGRRHERGDTIIEVMFAFVLFSMVIVGAFMIMNQGMALAQRSLEVTQVRQQIDSDCSTGGQPAAVGDHQRQGRYDHAHYTERAS